MPVYNRLCPACHTETEVVVSYDAFVEHSSTETAITCPCCGQPTAFYSLSHLKENLQLKEDNVLNFYGPGEQEKWFRSFGDLGRR